MVGNLRREVLESGGVQKDVVAPLLGQLHGYGPADKVAGKQLVHKTVAHRVTQHRAVAAERFGDERTGHGCVMERRRVELDELHVGDRDAGPKRHGYPVAGGLGGIGRDRVHLAGSAGGEHDMGRLDSQQVSRRVERHDARAPVVFHDEIEGEPVLVDRRGAVTYGRDKSRARPRHRWRGRRRVAPAPSSGRPPYLLRDGRREPCRRPPRGR